jgi:hypothetical protein
MPSVSIDNPAGRLYSILSNIEEKTNNLSQTIGSTVLTALAEALEVNENSLDVVKELGKIFELIKDTEESLKKVDMGTELYLSTLEEIADAFTQIVFFEKLYNGGRLNVGKASLEKLGLCAFILSQKQGEIVLNKEQLHELLSEVRGLLDKVLDSELDADIKQFLIKKLRDIEQAIIDYKFKGSEGLQEVLESSIGGAFLNINAEERKENPLVSNFFTIVTRLAAMLNIANTSKQLAPDVSNMLSKLSKLLPGGE